MKRQGKKGEEAYTIMELLVTVAILAIVATFGLSLVKDALLQSKKFEAESTQQYLLHYAQNLSGVAATAVRLSDFRQGQTYYRSNFSQTMPQPITAGSAAASFTVKVAGVDYTLPRNSSTLDIMPLNDRRGGATRSFVASRCVPAADFQKEFRMADFMTFEYFPVLTTEQPESPLVKCCRHTPVGLSCDSAETSTLASPWRVRLFYGGAEFLRVFPLISDLQHVSGAGFFATFDDAANPILLNQTLFVAHNTCLQEQEGGFRTTKCNDTPKVKTKTFDRQVLNEIHQSGVINLGR